MDPIRVPAVPPTPVKPTKIFGIPACFVLFAWCIPVILLIPLFFFYIFNYPASLTCCFSFLYELVYLSIFIVTVTKNKDFAALYFLPILLVGLDLTFGLSYGLSGFLHLFFHPKFTLAANYNTSMHMFTRAITWIIPFTIDSITVAMTFRAINDMERPASRVFPMQTELVNFNAFQ